MKEVLERLLSGEFTVEQALLALDASHVAIAGDLARLDPDRARRKGIPEVIFAPGKSPEVTADLAGRMLEASGQALVSRVTAQHDEALSAVRGATISRYGSGRRLLAPGHSAQPAEFGGVGLLAAGTSDVAVAEEARMMVDAMGLRSLRAYDVGVAALHRLEPPLREMIAAGVDALVVVAGMEGALPTVVAGLVGVPVIAVPASSGYGAGGGGLAALLSSLQSCSPGMTVVNIDNGIGGGAAAGLIAARMLAARGAAAAPGGTYARPTTSPPS